MQTRRYLIILLSTIVGIISCNIFSGTTSSSNTEDVRSAQFALTSVFREPTGQVSPTNSNQPAAGGPLMPPGIPTSQDALEETIITLRAGETLNDALRRTQKQVDFALAAPRNTAGFYVYGIRIVEMFGDTSVQVTFASKQRTSRKALYFAQGDVLGQRLVQCPNISLTPPPGEQVPTIKCLSKKMELGGVPAILLYISNPFGNSEVRIVWNRDGTEYELIGVNMEDKALVKIADSIEIVR